MYQFLVKNRMNENVSKNRKNIITELIAIKNILLFEHST